MTAAAAAPAGGSSASAVIPPEPPPAGAPPPATPPPVEPPATPPPATPPATPPPAEPPAAKGAPETYALTLPENGHLDAHDLTAIETIARQQGWTNDEAQQRVNDHAAAVAAQSAHFTEQTKADPVYGGAKLPETLKHAGLALDKLRPVGTPRGDAFRALLDKSGYGSHPEVVSLLADLGSAMAEDKTTGAHGGSGGGATTDAATLIYGDGPQVKS